MEHYGVQERELQWRSRRSKRDIPNVFHVALRGGSTSSLSHFLELYGAASDAPMGFPIVLSLLLRRRETPPSPPAPDQVGIENCKQLFSPLLTLTTQKKATHSAGTIFAVCVAFFWVVHASRNEKSCLQFLIPTAVFHMLLR